MNVKYYYEFKGHDDILNRVEILTTDVAVPQEITVSYTPFVLEYSQVKKLEPIQGSGATLGLISNTIFQFESLHTDDMQKYLVKFFRDGALYWMGWLDPELYEENLALYPPYPVEFTAADFNVLERLKFNESSGKSYADIVPLITQLKRCFDKLGLPFDKLYIGCSTTPEGVMMTATETALHVLYIQSANFYDEDNKPMSCKEVIESILEPFGLIMAQRDASIYIYDYNTVMLGLKMKMYDFKTFIYRSDESVSFILGDVAEIGFRSSNSPYGFEDMINNVSITSSIYAVNNYLKYEVKAENLRKLVSTSDQTSYTLKIYDECAPWTGNNFLLYESKADKSSLLGAKFNYTANDKAVNDRVFKNEDIYLIQTDKNNYIRIKANAYVNALDNPFDTDIIIDDERTRVMEIFSDLILTDIDGTPLMYYDNTYYRDMGWRDITKNGFVPNRYIMAFASLSPSYSKSRIANKWITNSGMIKLSLGTVAISRDNDGEKIKLPFMSGLIKLQLKYAIISDGQYENEPKIYPADKVKSILVKDVDISLENENGDPFNTDDYEFVSYINKNVVSDYRDVSLKCISANEDEIPIGKGNILKKSGEFYGLNLSFARAGQVNILERLLLCTIHSNYTRKNKIFTVDIKTTDNPAMRYSTLKSRWPDDKFLTAGCRIDFNRAITNLTVYNFSEDVDKLSEIPYE